jgi:5-methylcytosine-specific restriction protein B
MALTGFEQALAEFALGVLFACAAVWFSWTIFGRRKAGPPSTMVAQLAPPAAAPRTEQKPKPVDKAKSGSGISMSELSARTFTPVEDLEEIESILLDKKAVVLYGPPGTGKTKTATELTQHFTGPRGEYEVVVFHASYSYEDFVEGLRPRASGSGIDYPVVDGPLKRIAARARTRPKNRFVILIDEINRGNLARIFGELILMLEYRNYDVLLPYSGERFQLPENIYLLGTMNSADRGIALVDYALRRRFAFIEYPPSGEVLARYFDKNQPKINASIVLKLLTALNRKIRSEKSLGKSFEVGHAFFMEPELDETKLEWIWRFKIMPLLGEYYFDQPEQLEQFDLETMIAA